MLAIEISGTGDDAVLTPVERPIPQASKGEILIRVAAAGVARADILQRRGHYPPPAGVSTVPGLDVAGTVEDAAGMDWPEPGTRVCAILAGGGYAEYCVVPRQQVLPAPENWDDTEAGSLPESLFTAFDNLITRAQLCAGETLLVHGGSSGVGTMAIMLGKAWGAEVLATAGSDDKCEACRELGAALAINYRQTDFAEAVKEHTGGRGVDVVLDMVGGPYLARNLDVLALEGRISVIASQGGRTGELDLGKLIAKRGRIMASHMRARTPDEKGRVAERLRKEVWPLLPDKRIIRPVIDSTFPLREAGRAQAHMESSEHIGKIMLVV